MLTVKTILPLTAILVFGGAASAYAGNPTDNPMGSMLTAFESADVDQNGFLSRVEFMTYAQVKASDGDPVYADLVATADYDLAFAERDLNADGVVDRGEVGESQKASNENPKTESMKGEDMKDVPIEPYGSASEE